MIKRLVRVCISPAVAAGVLVVALIVGASWLVDHLGHGRLRPDPAFRRKNETALMLGTSPRLGARANPHFDNRIAAIAVKPAPDA